MIKFKEFPEERRALYCPDGRLFGVLNYNEHLYVRNQIIKKELEGYYFLINNKKYMIDVNGIVQNAPKGFFDTSYNLVRKCMDIRFKKGKTKK